MICMRNLRGWRSAFTALAALTVGATSSWGVLDWQMGYLDMANPLLRPASGGGSEAIPGSASTVPGTPTGGLIQIIFAGGDGLPNPAINPLLWGGNANGTAGNDVVLAVWAMGMVPADPFSEGVSGIFLYPSVITGASFEKPAGPLQSGDRIFARVWNLPAGTWTGAPGTTTPDFSAAGLSYVDSATRQVLNRANPPFPNNPTQTFYTWGLGLPTDDNIFSADRLADTAALPIPEPSVGLLALLGAAGLYLRRRLA